MAFKRSGVRFPSPPYRRIGRLDCWQAAEATAVRRLIRCCRAVGRFCESDRRFAGIAQLVEHDLAKVGVAGSSPVSRSKEWT